MNDTDFLTYFYPGSPVFRKLAKHIRWCGDAIEDLRFTSFSWTKMNDDKTALYFYNRYGAAVAFLDLKDFATKEYLLGYASLSNVEDLRSYMSQNTQQLCADVNNISTDMSELSNATLSANQNFSEMFLSAAERMSRIENNIAEFNQQIQLSIESIDSRLQSIESRLSV